MTAADQIAKYNGQLNYGGCCLVPESVAQCPECGALLYAETDCWVTDGGAPVIGSISVSCDIDVKMRHRYFQSDWMPIVDAVEKWCGATEG